MLRQRVLQINTVVFQCAVNSHKILQFNLIVVIFNSEPFCYLSATFYRHHRDHVQLAITLATPVKSHCITMATSCCPPMRMPSPCRAVRMWAAVAWQRNIYPTLAFGTQQWWRLRTTTTTITTTVTTIKRTAITVAATTLT